MLNNCVVCSCMWASTNLFKLPYKMCTVHEFIEKECWNLILIQNTILHFMSIVLHQYHPSSACLSQNPWILEKLSLLSCSEFSPHTLGALSQLHPIRINQDDCNQEGHIHLQLSDNAGLCVAWIAFALCDWLDWTLNQDACHFSRFWIRLILHIIIFPPDSVSQR